MSFIASLAAAGSAIAATAGTVGAGLAAGAGAIGSGLATAGGALASGAGALGSGLASGASALGSGIGSLGATIGEGAAALGEGLGLAGEGAAAGAEGAAAGSEGIGALAANPLVEFTPTAVEAAPVTNTAGLSSIATPTVGSTPELVANPLVTPTITEVAPQTIENTAANAIVNNPNLGWAQQAIQSLGLNPTSTSGAIASEALKQGVYGAGIGGLGGALTHPNDPMGGALQGAGLGLVTGGMGGAAAGGLGTMAGEAGMAGKIGTFAANNPGITGTAIGLPTSMALSSLTSPDTTLPTTNTQNNINPNKYRYTQPQWSIYQPQYFADGGVANLTQSGMFPQSQQDLTQYATPSQMPTSAQVVNSDYDASTNPYTGDIQGMAQGGIADLGGYAKGGIPNLLHGPGTGVSDSIPASIAGKQPARLASGEFVIPARVVSELGQGSTDAGAKILDGMVGRIQEGREKTIGKNKEYAKDTHAYKHLPV